MVQIEVFLKLWMNKGLLMMKWTIFSVSTKTTYKSVYLKH